MTPRSFTLLETLAVLVLLGLVAGWGLAAIDRSASPQLAADRYEAIDARARLLARTDGPQVLVLEGTRAQLGSFDAAAKARAFDLGAALRVESNDQPVDRIVYDRLAQSVDFTVYAEGNEAEILRVYGLTGWTELLSGGQR
ncbi:MAG: prepilin-type N-terminal cleavage/methylation domain-containing protein [Planctomycetota bacterium]